MSDVTVSVSYKGGVDGTDEEILDRAKSFGGELTGSGYFFATGERDVSVELPSEEAASKFCESVKEISALDWLEVVSIEARILEPLEDDDANAGGD